VIKLAVKQEYKPGQKVPKSGQYKNTNTSTEITAVEGERFPPTPKKGQKYILVDKTKHKKK
jgi:hypothetical protein